MWPNGAMRGLTVQWYSQAGESSLASNVTTSVCNVAHITGEPYLTGIPQRRGLVITLTEARDQTWSQAKERLNKCVCVCVSLCFSLHETTSMSLDKQGSLNSSTAHESAINPGTAGHSRLFSSGVFVIFSLCRRATFTLFVSPPLSPFHASPRRESSGGRRRGGAEGRRLLHRTGRHRQRRLGAHDAGGTAGAHLCCRSEREAEQNISRGCNF